MHSVSHLHLQLHERQSHKIKNKKSPVQADKPVKRVKTIEKPQCCNKGTHLSRGTPTILKTTIYQVKITALEGKGYYKTWL